MLIIEGNDARTGFKPTGPRVSADANTHIGEIEFSVVTGANGLEPYMKNLDGHRFVKPAKPHEYLGVMRPSLITFKLPVGCGYFFTKDKFFSLVNEDAAEFYSIEFDVNVPELREFVLHAHSTYVKRDAVTLKEVHGFNIEITPLASGSGPDFTAHPVAEVDPDIKNPPPVGG